MLEIHWPHGRQGQPTTLTSRIIMGSTLSVHKKGYLNNAPGEDNKHAFELLTSGCVLVCCELGGAVLLLRVHESHVGVRWLYSHR